MYVKKYSKYATSFILLKYQHPSLLFLLILYISVHSNIIHLNIHLGEGNGTPLQYSCLENPWTEESGGLQSMGSLSWTWLSDFTFTFHFHVLEKEWQPTPVFLPGESGGWGSLMSCHLWGCRVRQDRSDLAAAAAAAASTWFPWVDITVILFPPLLFFPLNLYLTLPFWA